MGATRKSTRTHDGRDMQSRPIRLYFSPLSNSSLNRSQFCHFARATLISAAPFSTVTCATHIDPKTGRPVETPEARYGKKGAQLSPSPVGAHHWPPMAYNPDTGLVYFP